MSSLRRDIASLQRCLDPKWVEPDVSSGSVATVGSASSGSTSAKKTKKGRVLFSDKDQFKVYSPTRGIYEPSNISPSRTPPPLPPKPKTVHGVTNSLRTENPIEIEKVVPSSSSNFPNPKKCQTINATGKNVGFQCGIKPVAGTNKCHIHIKK